MAFSSNACLLYIQVLLEMSKEGSSGKLGQLEMTPVARAIARHMCIDLSPEGLAARNRRGIAIIVYGAPLTGEAIKNYQSCIVDQMK